MLQRVELIGNVGFIEKKDSYTKFTVATTKNWKDKEGTWQSKTSWHNCVAFQKMGEGFYERVKKGYLVWVEGAIDYQKFKKEGDDKETYFTSIIANNFKILKKKDEDSSSKDDVPTDYGDLPGGPADDDDDLPF